MNSPIPRNGKPGSARYGSLPFGKRLTVSYLVLTSVAVFSLGIFGVFTLIEENRRIVENAALVTLDRVHESIGYRKLELERISDQMLVNPDFQRLLTASLFRVEEVLSLKNDVIPFFSALVQRSPMRLSVAFLFPEGPFPEIFYGLGSDNPAVRGNYVEVIRLRSATDPEESRFTSAKLVWNCDERDAAVGAVAFGRRIINVNSLSPVGVMRGRVNSADFFAPAASVSEERIHVVDDLGRGVYPLDLDFVYDPGPGDEALSFERKIDGTPWRLILTVPESSMSRGALRIVLAALIASAVVFAVTTVFGVIFARFLNGRVVRVVDSIKAFEAGDFHVRIPEDRDDEFGRIAHAFNGAVETIEGLMRQVYNAELEKRDAELRLLQAQINPHFLYNSLSSISRLARLGRGETAHELVLALSRFYRLALNEGRDRVTIREELDRVASYLRVQSIKHEGRLHSFLELDEKAASTSIPHLILQPFVENAIEHAWKECPLTVTARARLADDRVIIEVADDGIGMSPEQARSLLSQTDPSYGYGIYNVVTRLRIYYGESSRLSIHSEVGRGTRAVFDLPLILPNSLPSDRGTG